MKLTKTGKPSHAKRADARKKKPIQHFDTTKAPKHLTWSHIRRHYNKILEAQTPDDIDESWNVFT